MENSKFKMYRDKVETMLDELFTKPDLTAVELKNATDALCFIEKLDKIERGDAMQEEYGSYGANSWVASGPYPDYGDNYGRRMRSSTTGRYMNNQTYGHSIKDRMVAQLEDMMDQAHNDYERKEIQNEIQKLRMNDMM